MTRAHRVRGPHKKNTVFANDCAPTKGDAKVCDGFVRVAHATLAYVQLLGRYFATTVPAHAHVTEAAFRVGVNVTVEPETAALDSPPIVTVLTPFASTPVTLAYLPVGKGGGVVTAAVQVPRFWQLSEIVTFTPSAMANASDTCARAI